MSEGVQNRSCGECSECCVVMKVTGVAEGKLINKPEHTPCAHQRAGGGCTVYHDRPGPCARWSCMWRKGEVGTEDERPDKTGYIVHEVPIRDRLEVIKVVAINQSRSGAASSKAARRTRRDLINQGRIVITDTGTQRGEVHQRIIAKDTATLPGRIVIEAVQTKSPIHFVSTRESR